MPSPRPAVTSPAASAAPVAVPPFSPATLRHQLVIDALVRWAAVAVIAALVVVATWTQRDSGGGWVVLVVAMATIWVALSTVSAGAWRSLPAITALVEQDPTQAEAALALTLRRRPLQRSVRLLLYHRLALLRYRQERFGEAAEICQALLARRPTAAGPLRASLLLMLAEASLRRGELEGAAEALRRLAPVRLGLADALQRMALQVRYEVAAGRDADALADLDRKIQSAELLPGSQCGAIHALLSAAAQRAGQPQVARWLRQRADLLCTPEELRHVFASVGWSA